MNHQLPRRRFLQTLATAAAVSATLATPLAALADTWPSKAIKLIVPFPPGGATDASARLVAEHLGRRLGQAVIVENKPGASTIIGVDMAAKAAPDGYTLLVTGGGTLAVLPALRNNLPFDVNKDFVPITQLVSAPVVLVTSSAKPFNKLTDFIAAAKAHPKDLRYSTYGAGSAPHLAGEMLSNAAGIELEPIPFKGASEALLALLRGEVDLGFETLSAASAHIKSGKLRVLSLNGENRSPFYPDAPGMGELGLAPASIEAFYCLLAPAGTPPAITTRLNKEVQDIMAQPDVKERMAAMFLEINAAGPEAMTALVKSQTAKFKAIAQKAKILTTAQ